MSEINSSYLWTGYRGQNVLFDAGEVKNVLSQNLTEVLKCSLFLFVFFRVHILVPLHDQDAHGCHKWDCEQRGNKDPEGLSSLQS